MSVVAKGFDMHGEPVAIEGSELLARAIQHETDHLDGVLFIDRLDAGNRKPAMKAIRESEWFGLEQPTVKVSPAPTRGLGLLVRAGLRRHARRRRCPPSRRSRRPATSWSAWSPDPTRRPGRGRRLAPSPVAARAEELGVPVLKPDHPRDPEFQEALRALAPDCCPVVAYGALLPQSALDIPAHGWVNLHFSVLPAWRGAAPVQHAIWAGDEVTGATTFRIVRELDAGPTYGVMTERVRPTDTAGDLLARLAEGGAGLLVATLDGIEDGTLEARPQPEDGVSLAPKITVEDARVDWTEPAMARRPADPRLHAGPRRVDDVRGRAGQARPAHAGRRRRSRPASCSWARTPSPSAPARAPLELGEVKAFGKKQMPAADWARGVRLEPGARFGD